NLDKTEPTAFLDGDAGQMVTVFGDESAQDAVDQMFFDTQYSWPADLQGRKIRPLPSLIVRMADRESIQSVWQIAASMNATQVLTRADEDPVAIIGWDEAVPPDARRQFSQPLLSVRSSDSFVHSLWVLGELSLLPPIADESSASVETVDGVRGSFIEGNRSVPEMNIKPNREALARYGLTIADITDAIRLANDGVVASELLFGRKPVPLIVRTKGQLEKQQILIKSDVGTIPLAMLADIEVLAQPSEIRHYNHSRAILVTIEVEPNKVDATRADVLSALESIVLPHGASVLLEPEAKPIEVWPLAYP
ncbi:MAG: efflux RND transporter permease subunit, partial [Proteobacteria bacterium]|nr:efflux RND transporter permease subunit [Pseudomonadota bacterium]